MHCPRRLRAIVVLVVAVTLAASCARTSGGRTGAATTTPSTPPTTSGTSATGAATTDAANVSGASTSSVTTAPATPPPGGYASAITDIAVDNPAFAALETDVLQRVRTVGLPGASLLVVHRGKLVEQEAWLGYTLQTTVPIASGSKWLTAATLMTLVDEGKLALDAPLSTYEPAARGPVGAITLRQLLSFTSGLTAADRVPCIEDPSSTLADCARQVLARGVVHPPGEAFRYGSQHMVVAGALAEQVTGTPFAQLFRERIAIPLGMTRTTFVQSGSGGQVENVTNPNPAGTAISTLGDYGRFLEMLSHDGVAPSGRRILSSAAIAEMQRDQIGTARYATASPFRVGTKAPYGLGEWIDWTDRSGRPIVLSSDGAFGFRPWIDKQNDLFGVYLIVDRGEGYVDGNPDAPADDGGKVHTSGLWVFSETAEAVGGSLPKEYYPHR